MTHHLLIVSVGGSPAPIVFHIANSPPDTRVVFVCSRQSESQIAEIKSSLAALGRPLPESATEPPVLLADSDNIQSCVAALQRQLAPLAARWLQRGPNFEIIVNFTGGTKPMSAALVTAARDWPCQFAYVAGDARSKDGLGVVLSGSEHLVTDTSPWHALNVKAIEDAAALANSSDWSAAAAILAPAVKSTIDPARKRTIASLNGLFQAFAAWDHFEHAAAAKFLTDVQRGFHDLSLYLSHASLAELESKLPAYQTTLADLTGEIRIIPKIADLLANAERRLAESRPDDATARTYRVIEGISQYQLSTHGIQDTARPNPARLPPSLAHLAGKPIALQDGYKVLAALGDPIGQAFKDLGLDTDAAADRFSPLTARNLSILAHGWKPVGVATAKSLLDKAFDLAAGLGISRQSLIRFPSLTTLGRPV